MNVKLPDKLAVQYTGTKVDPSKMYKIQLASEEPVTIPALETVATLRGRARIAFLFFRSRCTPTIALGVAQSYYESAWGNYTM